MKKLLFIDTNVFLNCVFERVEKLNCEPLQGIFKELQNGEFVLIMPEIIEKEISNSLEKFALDLKTEVKKYNDSFQVSLKQLKVGKKTSQFIRKLKERNCKILTLLQENQKMCFNEIETAYKDGLNVVRMIISHKNTEKIVLTDKLILNGMRRSLFKISPFSHNKDKQSYTKDQDCIAFESVLNFLKKGKYQEHTLITCIDDVDYNINKKNNTQKNNIELKTEIKDELKKFCNNIKSYDNPLKMLKKEFSQHYTKADIAKYSGVSTTSSGMISIFENFSKSAMINPLAFDSNAVPVTLTVSNLTNDIVTTSGVNPSAYSIIGQRMCPKCDIVLAPGLNFCLSCNLAGL